MSDQTSTQRKPLKPLPLIEDEPVRGLGDDHLNLDSVARIVAGAAVGTRGPFTIGVYANWGQGKTSALRLARDLIRKDEQGRYDDVVTVWFNAWQYEKEDHPIIPLVGTIVREVDRARELAERGTLRNVAKGVVEGWSRLSRALRAVAYGFSATTKVGVPGFGEVEAGFVAKEMIERYEKLAAKEDPLLQRSLYFNAFEMLEKLAGDGDDDADSFETPRIVVFVDDLDRCLPDKALKLLESIKLVLAQPGFNFVLGVDNTVIEDYLTKRFKEARSYLDKIVQLPLPLPPHHERFEEYIKRLVHARLKAPDDAKVADVLKNLAPVLTVAADETPRSLVRLINNLLVDRRLRQLSSPHDDLDDAEFLGLCAVARSLQHHLGLGLYRELADDKWKLCAELAAKPVAKAIAELSPEKGTELDYAGGERLKLLRELQLHDSVRKLFEHDYGKKWLSDPSLRMIADAVVAARPEEERRPTEPEEKPDSAKIIGQAIRTALNKPTGQITIEDKLGITGLHLAATGVTDVSPLKELTRLQTLDLSLTGVTDLSPLKELTQLQTLYLIATLVTDLSPLKGLTQLRELTLSGTDVTDVSALKGLTQLRVLNLISTGVTDVSPLNGLTQLRVLDLTGTPVEDVSPLDEIPNLQIIGGPGTKARPGHGKRRPKS